ncbi:hypothetical protein HK096_005777 [Nowakowskiella sp. JEL0078]|nr:hypothetical protein HK096_005777 [Nowakowskiella sp. JEL0078]
MEPILTGLALVYVGAILVGVLVSHLITVLLASIFSLFQNDSVELTVDLHRQPNLSSEKISVSDLSSRIELVESLLSCLSQKIDAIQKEDTPSLSAPPKLLMNSVPPPPPPLPLCFGPSSLQPTSYIGTTGLKKPSTKKIEPDTPSMEDVLKELRRVERKVNLISTMGTPRSSYLNARRDRDGSPTGAAQSSLPKRQISGDYSKFVKKLRSVQRSVENNISNGQEADFEDLDKTPTESTQSSIPIIAIAAEATSENPSRLPRFSAQKPLQNQRRLSNEFFKQIEEEEKNLESKEDKEENFGTHPFSVRLRKTGTQK